MKVFKDLDKIPPIPNAVITTGTFDGVHVGHQKIIRQLNMLAEENGGESVILTFHPHPRFVVNPHEKSLKLIHTLDEKVALLERYGIDNLVVAAFSKEFSEIAARDYISDFLVARFRPKVIVIGYDHRFGKGRLGDIDLLRQYREEFNYQVVEISKLMLEDIAVSSTKIRAALNAGKVAEARHLLGHTFTISGFVVKGEQIGKTMGFPTANIHVASEYKLIPKNGVYAVVVVVGGYSYKGMLNIGYRPTFEGTRKTIEANIFEFNRDIYGEQIRVELIDQIRTEQKFESKDRLMDQLARDKETAQAILKNIKAYM